MIHQRFLKINLNFKGQRRGRLLLVMQIFAKILICRFDSYRLHVGGCSKKNKTGLDFLPFLNVVTHLTVAQQTVTSTFNREVIGSNPVFAAIELAN